MVYQPVCTGCRACVPLRVEVGKLERTKGLRRLMKRNGDLRVSVAEPRVTLEKWELYERYQREWHGKDVGDEGGAEGFVRFLYDSPVETAEFEYRNGAGKLIGVGICDVSLKSVSSVYFYFEPGEKGRSLGTFSAVYEMLWAREMGIPYWYAGYWVKGCGAMEYKARFRPCEVLGTDGVWRVLEEKKS
jgi:arginine-tRNA-protein transferase